MNNAISPTSKQSFLFYLKLGLLFFWAIWIGLAFTTNITDFLYNMGIISSDFKFRSGNYILLGSTLSIYHLSPSVHYFLFIIDMFVQGLAAILFFVGAICFWRNHNESWRYINLAFALSIALWCVFLIMEEIFIAYAFESGHRDLVMFELISLFVIHLLPHKE